MNMEWSKAQQIGVTVNLTEAAKQHLQFLAAVDSIGCLYDGPALDRAINRYKYCWLPFLAKHMECSVVEGPLVVPLDCEWIWHCHRLNPLQYKRDCEEIFRQILDKKNVLSSVGGNCSKQTETIWNKIYVSEPFHLDLENVLSQASSNGVDDLKTQRSTEYDLVEAVKRQSSFFSKVSQMMKYDNRFLDEAVARYKSFLHLSKMLMERNIAPFCVPTHDIDLIWHTHQLYPAAYCEDLTSVFGKVMDHNDRDSGSSESGKNSLDLMFLKTKALWEDTYGCMYSVREAATQKNGLALCMMDHVPGLGMTETQSGGDCFITCSLMTDDANCANLNADGTKRDAKAKANRANCIINCYLGTDGHGGIKRDVINANRANCIINCYLGVGGTERDVNVN